MAFLLYELYHECVIYFNLNNVLIDEYNTFLFTFFVIAPSILVVIYCNKSIMSLKCI